MFLYIMTEYGATTRDLFVGTVKHLCTRCVDFMLSSEKYTHAGHCPYASSHTGETSAYLIGTIQSFIAKYTAAYCVRDKETKLHIISMNYK